MEKHRLCRADAIEDGRSDVFTVGGKRIIVMRKDGAVLAYRNFCPHMGGEMRFNGCDLKCMMHGSLFDADSGEPRTAPATGSGPLERIELVEEDGELYAMVAKPERSPWADDF